MWLINCYTYALEYFNDPEDAVFPKGVDGKGYDGYLILSHTWGDGEVSFHEMHDIKGARQKKGFRKIESMCNAARQESYGYVWVDTCCIDKSSSAELTESINSMFRWYREADCCVVYLEDLAPGEGNATEDQLRPCRWFTRGWTLQELIAPDEIKFVDASWTLRGTKETLFAALHNITGIDNMVLRSSYNLDRVAVARRMSWAASRETTRIEDKAYCLMGIFGVNMPLIYGERERAFIRLQETIAQQSDDLSLFAWVGDGWWGRRDLFADNPLRFETCGEVYRLDDPVIPPSSFVIGNNTIQLSTALGYIEGEEGDLVLHLQCTKPPDDPETYHRPVLVLRLRQSPKGFIRLGSDVVDQSSITFRDPAQVSILKIAKLDSGFSKWRSSNSFLQVQLLDVDVEALEPIYLPSHLWDPRSSSFATGASDSFIGLIKLVSRADTVCWIFCGLVETGAALGLPEHDVEVDDSIWVAVIPTSNRSNFTALAGLTEADLSNCYSLSNAGIRFRAMYRKDPTSLPMACSIKGHDGTPLRISVDPRILADGNRWKSVVRITAKTEDSR